MKHHATCIHGQDVLANVVIDPKLLRLNIESELRNKMVQIREDYLSYPQKSDFFLFIVPVMQMLWEGMLYLHGKTVPENMLVFFEDVEKYFG